jgi:cytochrome c
LSQRWPDAKNEVGPELNGLSGRRSGSVQDFNYSDANKKIRHCLGRKDLQGYLKDPAPKLSVLKDSRHQERAGDHRPWAYLKKFDAEGLRNRGMHESDALAYQHRFECAPGASA